MTIPYQPKTGEKCSCRRGIERDNCSACEGTGWKIDFRAIRARSIPAPKTEPGELFPVEQQPFSLAGEKGKATADDLAARIAGMRRT